MYTTFDKALIALLLAALSILNILFGIELFGVHTEQAIGIIIAVLIPILVWWFPNKQPARLR
jgi:TctA family transporter